MSAAQTLRNALQRDLIGVIGAAGSAYVRFIYGLPFAALFLALIGLWRGEAPPVPGGAPLAFAAAGGAAQILATGLLLAAMRETSFVAASAYSKTEPAQLALFGLVLLGDPVTWTLAAAIALCLAGVWLASGLGSASGSGGGRAAAYGLGCAAMFALSAVGYRAGVRAMGGTSLIGDASSLLVCALAMQSGAIVLWLGLSNRPLLTRLWRLWRSSLAAGAAGAFASECWFLAFALDSAARVRTLALIEMIFAQWVGRAIFKQKVSWRELSGAGLIMLGVGVLING